jgi:hypothetical protein
MVTAQELRENPELRQGMTVEELRQAGLTELEATTVAAGFTQPFGEGRARDFRQNLVDSQSVPITQAMADLALNPELPVGAEFQPVLQQVQSDEILQTTQLPGTVQAAPVADIAAPTITAAQAAQAAPVDAEQVAGIAGEAAQVAPVTTQAVDPLLGTQFNLSDEATVRGQLASLFADVESGEIPAWAKASHNAAMEALASRRLQGSSIAAGAIVLAMQQAALPIAAADANVYFQKDLAEFNSEQQASLINFQTRQQNMLNDVSIQNAANQFNASSQQQQQQFVAGLVSNIKQFNTNLISSTNQFNAAQANSIAATNAGNSLAAQQFNAQKQLTLNQFNATLKNQRQIWNAENQAIVNQSNTIWRRNINTSNTAAQNSANAVNVQNRFNLSNQSLNNLWQEYRDNAAWYYEASESEKQRAYNLAIISGNREYLSDSREGEALGSFATSILRPSIGAVGNSISGIIGGGLDFVKNLF